MKKMKLKLILLFSILSTVLTAQNKKNVDYISLKYSISSVVFQDAEIIVSSPNYNSKTYTINVKYYEYTKEKTKIITISEEEFNSIVDHFYNIKSSDLIDSFEIGLDGAITELEIGNFLSNSINYTLWGLHKKDSNTKLKDTIETIQLILKLSEIKINDFN